MKATLPRTTSLCAAESAESARGMGSGGPAFHGCQKGSLFSRQRTTFHEQVSGGAFSHHSPEDGFSRSSVLWRLLTPEEGFSRQIVVLRPKEGFSQSCVLRRMQASSHVAADSPYKKFMAPVQKNFKKSKKKKTTQTCTLPHSPWLGISASCWISED